MKIFLFFIALILNGCSGRYLPNWNHPRIGVSQDNIVVVADNQFHNLFTDPSFFANINSDAISKVSIRPPQLNLFSEDIFSYILYKTHPKYIIHLGDALNVNSTTEWQKFIGIIDNRSQFGHQGWVLVPGNHDAYFYGITAGKPDVNRQRKVMKSWYDAAKNTGQKWAAGDLSNNGLPVTKDILLRQYLSCLFNQGSGFPDKQDALKVFDTNDFSNITCSTRIENIPVLKEKPISTYYENKKPGDKFITKLAWRYEDDFNSYQKSFLVQEIIISQPIGEMEVRGILIDTTNYHKRPSNKAAVRGINGQKVNAGIAGQVSEEQFKIIEKWIKENKDSHRRYVLLGHHPLVELSEDAITKISNLTNNDIHFVGYVSAHTHNPKKYNEKKIFLNFPEYNIGSTTDWPPQFAKFSMGNTIDNIEVKSVLQNDRLLPDCLFESENELENYLEYKNIPWWWRFSKPATATRNKNLAIQVVAFSKMFKSILSKSDKQKISSQDLAIINAIISRSDIFNKSDDIPSDVSHKSDISLLKKITDVDLRLRNNHLLDYSRRRANYGLTEAYCASKEEGTTWSLF